MSFAIPPVGHEARDAFDLPEIARFGSDPVARRAIPAPSTVIAMARDFFSEEPAAVALHSFARTSARELVLLRVSRPNAALGIGHIVWVFGSLEQFDA